MIVMILYGGFYPAQKYGGPVVSIDNITRFLSENKYYIIAGDHEYGSKERLDKIQEGWNRFSSNVDVLYLPEREHNASKYRAIIKEIKPDVIYLNTIYFPRMVFSIIRAARKEHKPILIAPRGGVCRNALAIKTFKKKPYISLLSHFISKRNTAFHSTSLEETEQIKKLFRIDSGRVFEVENVPSIPSNRIISCTKSANELTLGFFARICQKKNLLYAIDCLKLVRGNVTLNIYGNIEDDDYWERCKLGITQLPSNIQVNYKGEYSHDDVFRLMAENNALFFPTLSENYGHVIVEALLSTLPIIISDQTPWNGVNHANCGYALPLDNREGFAEAIEHYAAMDSVAFDEVRERVDCYVEETLALNQLKSKYQNMLYCVGRFDL